MKNSKRIVLSLLLSFVTVPVWAISISCDQNLQFGTIIAPVSGPATVILEEDTSAGTPKLTFSGNATPNVNLLSSGSVNNPTSPQLAKCTVTGPSGEYFKITINPLSSVGITYKILTPNPNYLQIPTNNGSTTFFIGGILDLQNAASGSNNQNFSVVVTTCTYDAQNISCT